MHSPPRHDASLLRPADKATRVITEIAIESLPQCLLQSYILIVVMHANSMGTSDPHLLAMVDDAVNSAWLADGAFAVDVGGRTYRAEASLRGFYDPRSDRVRG